jgi:hypothetical protein
MGLEEHIKAGAVLTRNTIQLSSQDGLGSVDLGSVFNILQIQTASPARLRLYDRESSRNDATEIARPFGAYPSTDIALIGDFSMSAAGTYAIVPTVFGVAQISTNAATYYRIEDENGLAAGTFAITRFLLEDATVQPEAETPYTVGNRRVLTINQTLAQNAFASGTLANTPKTFMLISGSLANAAHKARIRFYASSSAIYNTTERNRAFATEAPVSVGLISDILIDDATFPIYFTPKLFAANLENIGNNLQDAISSPQNIAGNSEIYYYMQNIGSTTATITFNVAVYSLED